MPLVRGHKCGMVVVGIIRNHVSESSHFNLMRQF